MQVYTLVLASAMVVITVIRHVHSTTLIRGGCAHSATNRAAQRTICSREQRYQKKNNDQRDHDRAVTHRSAGVGAESNAIVPLYHNFSDRHIDEIMAAVLRALYPQVVEQTDLISVH